MLKIYLSINQILGIIFLNILLIFSAQGQTFENGTYTEEVADTAANLYSNPLKIGLPSQSPSNTARSGYLYTQLDLPNNYGDVDFNAEIIFSLKIANPTSSTICNRCQLSINQNSPKSVYFLDLIQNSALLNADSIAVEIDSISVTSSNQDIGNLIFNELRVKLNYEITYGISVTGVRIDTLMTFIKDKTATFQWTTSSLVPNFQFQLLRLYNVDETRTQKENIQALVDWSKATTIETQSSQTSLKLTLAEGTGFYVWRVRPIGSQFEGGITNPQNYGNWTSSGTVTAVGFNGINPDQFPLDDQNKRLVGFFFYDPDDQVNNIYSRTFTEENRVSESITYFNGLQQTKQSQTRIPSQKNTITTQTLQDYSGRPALTTLPVPEREEGLKGYKSEFVKRDTSIYTVKDFDQDSTIQNPNTISQDDQSPFKYYKGENYTEISNYEGVSDTVEVKNIPNAEGYAFTRTLYYNDGTDRVREQSGVGKTHMIGDGQGDHGGGKTVKTFFETATEGELIRLFGDEAPDAASVIKTITIDQNQTASITYTSKEGNVIATCLIQADQNAQGLKALEDSAQVSPVIIEDQVSANFQKFTKIASSKRINLNTETSVEISYKNACTQEDTITLPACSFLLNVLIKRLDGQAIVGAWQDSTQARAVWDLSTDSLGFILSQDTIVSCYDSLTFRNINLPAGSYIIEKQLSPTSDFYAKAKNLQEKIGDKTTPLINMISNWLDSVKCNGGWDHFYDKLETLSDSLEACANIEDSLLQANCYQSLDSLYRSDLGIDSTSFFEELHRIKVRRSFEIIINTPECFDLRIPLTNDQIINCDSVNTDFYGKDHGNDQIIHVNPFMFLDEGLKATNNDSLIRTEFYPDFEGYAYSFFWDCTPSENEMDVELDSLMNVYTGLEEARLDYLYIPTNVDLEDLLKAYYIDSTMQVYQALGLESPTGQDETVKRKLKYIYYHYLIPYIKGWDVSGTFNTMIFHMLNDKYSTDGYSNDMIDPLNFIYEGPQAMRDECGQLITLAGGESPNTTVTYKFPQSQYYCQELLACWVNQLAYIKNTVGRCPNELWLDIDFGKPPYRLSDRIDDENEGDQAVHDTHFDDNIKLKGFFKKLLFGRKIRKASKKVRSLQIPIGDDEREVLEATDEDAYISINPQYHAINEFLNCTGYKFAKILSPLNPRPLNEDLDNAVSDYFVPSADTITWTTYNGKNRGYYPNPTWQLQFQDSVNNVLELFEYISDPVYAFKYFEYPFEVTDSDNVDNAYRGLELMTCYKQYDTTCYICGLGNVKCQVTHPNWSAGQRFAFYQNLKTYTPVIEDTILYPQPKDYLAPGYIDEVDDIGTLGFVLWDDDSTYLDVSTYNMYKDSSFVIGGERLLSKVELDIAQLNRQVGIACEAKRSELKNKLISLLSEKCYEIVTCCASDSINTSVGNSDASSNAKILEKDIDVLVEQMILQCKERGQVGSVRLYNKNCKYASNFGRGDTVVEVEYGVVNSQDTIRDVYFHCRNSLDTNSVAFNENDTITLQYVDIVTGDTLDIVDMSQLDYSDDDDSLNYCEWNARREVMEMEMNINIPNRCPNQDSTLANANDASCISPKAEQTQPGLNGGNALPSDWRTSPTVLRTKVIIEPDDVVKREPSQQ